jgi:hypothetical protein
MAGQHEAGLCVVAMSQSELRQEIVVLMVLMLDCVCMGFRDAIW